LRTRAIFGALMALVALTAILLGDTSFALLVGVAAGLLGWEWSRLCGRGRFGGSGVAMSTLLVLVVVLTFRDLPGLALIVCGGGAVAIGILARLQGHPAPLWAAFGPAYLGPPLVALLWLRGHDAAGEWLILWLVLAVVATDTGAFFAGRLIGGPLLAPRLSPKKTWAGLGGAVVSSAAIGIVCGAAIPGAPGAGVLALAGGVLALIAQAGDLAESAIKRHFGVKDASGLIPGHGGVFDRVDGLVAAAAALALLQWASGGAVIDWSGVGSQ
jgi:phosphatidate cytidylyltransferase